MEKNVPQRFAANQGMAMMDKGISIVIPCFNEASHIGMTLERISTYFIKKGIKFEVIIVDDGSTDSTIEGIQAVAKRMGNIRIYKNPKNMGKGYAVGVGVAKSSASYILFTDADMSTPIEEFEKFIAYIDAGEKIMIGSRKMPGAKVEIRQAEFRGFLGKGFTKLSNFILKTNYSDFTCGFKCFEATLAKQLFAMGKIYRWGFDAEILFLARKLKINVVEIPIIWHNDFATKVDLKKDILGSFIELIKVRMIHRD